MDILRIVIVLILIIDAIVLFYYLLKYIENRAIKKYKKENPNIVYWWDGDKFEIEIKYEKD